MLILRDAVQEDVGCILHIYNRAILTTTATFDLEEETIEQRLEWFSHYGGKYPLIIAELDGLVVGYCYLSKFRQKPAYDRTAEISVYINEHYRGKGFGKLLYAEILKRAREFRYHAIIACITAGNEVSVRMHKQFGFEPAGQMKEVGFKFNEWLDIEFYQLLLPESSLS